MSDASNGTAAAITVTGVCAGPVVVATDGLTRPDVAGLGTAVIDGGASDAVTMAGATRSF